MKLNFNLWSLSPQALFFVCSSANICLSLPTESDTDAVSFVSRY